MPKEIGEEENKRQESGRVSEKMQRKKELSREKW